MRAKPNRAPQARGDQLKTFLREAAGTPLEIHVVRPPDYVMLLISGQRPELVRVCRAWFQHADLAKAGTGPLCMTCDTEFNRETQPAAIYYVIPFARRPATAMVTGVCHLCFGRLDQQSLLAHYRKVWPDAYFDKRFVGAMQ
jgi:hypothetical protein